MNSTNPCQISSPLFIGGQFLLILVLFLFSPGPVKDFDPAVQDEFCGSYVRINKYAGFIVNCDTRDYLEAANNPNILLKQRSTRMSRPLYIIIGAIFGSLLKPITGFSSLDLYYWSFIILNFIIITASLLLYHNMLISLNIDKYLISISSVYLICNDIFRSYFWSATPQLFGIFTPIATVYAGLAIIEKKTISTRYFAAISLLFGLLPLIYGTFIVLILMIIIACYYNLAELKQLSIISITKYAVIVSIFFSLPTIIWIIISTYISGEYYNAEVEIFREIVWILDYFKYGIDSLTYKFLANTYRFFSTLMYLDILPFILLSLFSSIYLFFNVRDKKNRHSNELQTYALLSFVIAFFFFFFWVLGYYAARLTFTIVPSLIMFTTIVLNRILKKVELFYKNISIIIMFFITFIWCYYHITKYGPFG